jgi:hypothetical protein
MQKRPEAKRMLADPKSSMLVDSFAAQWLGGKRLDRSITAYDRPPRYSVLDEHREVAAGWGVARRIRINYKCLGTLVSADIDERDLGFRGCSTTIDRLTVHDREARDRVELRDLCSLMAGWPAALADRSRPQHADAVGIARRERNFWPAMFCPPVRITTSMIKAV